jgi:hypothetical protein
MIKHTILYIMVLKMLGEFFSFKIKFLKNGTQIAKIFENIKLNKKLIHRM